ncbi:MAG: sterol desaturase family protein [Actinocatenispora sp.]
MTDYSTLAIPALALLMVVEIVSFRFFPDKDKAGYTVRDTLTSLAMGIGSVVANLGWNALTLVSLVFVHQFTPLRIPFSWVGWLLTFVAYDLTYYWQHRASHRIRILWAGHVAHHSSQRFNLSTGFRISWTAIGTMPIMFPMVLLGFHPVMILATQSINFTYQFWLHTERVDRLWAPVEWLFNTPTHHRVHHSSTDLHLDRNFGGVFIVWDRLFGTLPSKDDRPVYGLTHNIDTYNPLRVTFHEYAAIARDLVRVRGLVTRLGILLAPPAWSHDAVRAARTETPADGQAAAAPAAPTDGAAVPSLTAGRRSRPAAQSEGNATSPRSWPR